MNVMKTVLYLGYSAPVIGSSRVVYTEFVPFFAGLGILEVIALCPLQCEILRKPILYRQRICDDSILKIAVKGSATCVLGYYFLKLFLHGRLAQLVRAQS